MTHGAVWPWLTLVGLGAFHGLNPAMGWLFVVALGLLHRRGRQIVLLSLLPIAFGHALSIWSVAASVMILDSVVDGQKLRFTAGVIQILWGHLRPSTAIGIACGWA